MLTNKPKFVVLGAIVAYFLFALVIFGLVHNRKGESANIHHFTEVRSPISSTLSPSHNNLNIIVLTFKNPNLANSEKFILTLSEDNKPVRTLEFSGANLGDPSDLKFQFEPLPNSQGKTYELTLENKSNAGGPQVSVGLDYNGNLVPSTYYRSAGRIEAMQSVPGEFLSRVKDDVLFFSFLTALLAVIFLLAK